MQLGDVFASQTLNVQSADQVVSSAVAAGNIASATGQNADLSFTSQQTVKGGGVVQADAAASSTGSAGAYMGVTASATGNSATAGTCCGLTSGTSVQTVEPFSAAQATANALLGGRVDQLSADALAVGNTQGWLAANGEIRSATTQSLQSYVSADTSVVANIVNGDSGASATAVGNDVTVSATASPVDIRSTQSLKDTGVVATLTVQQQAGDTVTGQATATGNNVSVQNDGGAALTQHAQTNDANIAADAAYGLGTWNSASVGAYGVGNSILLSTSGPQAEMVSNQASSGTVEASASLRGGGGADSLVSATAIGNAVSGYICSTCDGGVGVKNSQSNTGAVRATSTYKGPATGSVVGSANAVGNSATYVVKSSGG